MSQTFDIRFAQSSGLAGLFEAPANEYRWKGAGRLSIDSTGISIARRGLLTLFRRVTTRRIPTDDLIEVYREGNALRLEFSTQESPRTVLPIWVGDRDSAARIVTLLPTQRSVELEEGDGASARRYRFDRKLVALLLIGVMALGAGALILQRFFAPDLRTRPVEAHELPAPAASAKAAPDDPAPTATPVVPAAPASAAPSPARFLRNPIARAEFERFQAQSNALRSDYLSMRANLTAEGLEDLEARWRDVATRIYDNQDFEGTEFSAQRELELAVARGWRYYLSIHAAGLRADDQDLIELAAAHLAFVETLEARLSSFAL